MLYADLELGLGYATIRVKLLRLITNSDRAINETLYIKMVNRS